MQRSHIAIVILALLAATALVLVFSPADKAPLPGPEREGRQEEPAPAPALTQPPLREGRDSTRVRNRGGGTALQKMSPTWQKAMGGIKGRVVHAGGEPAVRLEVAVIGDWLPTLLDAAAGMIQGREPERSFSPLRDSVLTDEEGRFFLRGVYPAETSLLRISEKGDTLLATPTPLTPAPGETVDVGDIVLPGFGVLTGRILDREKEMPLPGVEVFASVLPGIVAQAGFLRLQGREWLLARFGGDRAPLSMIKVPRNLTHLRRLLTMPSARTDREGRFRLERVPAGLVNLSLGKRGFRPQCRLAVRSRAGEERELGDFRLSGEHRLQLLVCDGEEEPLAGVRILAGTMPPLVDMAIMRLVGVTDRAGRLEVSGLGDNSIYLAAARPGDAWKIVGPIGPGPEQKIVLARGHDLTLQCLTSPQEGEQPLEPSEVRLTLPYSTQTLDRHIQVKPGGIVELRGVKDGIYVLHLAVEGYASHQLPLRLPLPEGVREMVKKVHFRRGERLQVIVRTAADAPVAGARLIPLVEPKEVLDMPLFDPSMEASYTDEQGRAELGPLGGKRIALAVWHPRHGSKIEEVRLPVDRPLVIRLLAGAIEGRLVPGGLDGEGRPYQVFLFQEDSPCPLQNTVARADGTFSFKQVPAGRARLSAVAQQGALPIERFALAMTSRRLQPLGEERVRVEAGRTAQVTIDLGGEADRGVIEGVVYLAGRPAEGIEVQARRWRGPRVVTGKDGRFRLENLKPGEVQLLAGIQDPGFETQTRAASRVEVKLPPGGLVRQDLHLFAGRIEGTIRDSRGRPQSTVMVTARPQEVEGEAGRIQALTGADGRYAMKLVKPGRWKIEARGENIHCERPVQVQVPRNGTATAPDIKILFTVNVTLRLDPPPAEDTRVRGIRFIPLDEPGSAPIDKGIYRKRAVIPVRLPAGRYKLEVYEGNQAALRTGQVTVPRKPGESLTVRLTPAAGRAGAAPVSYAGTLVDKQDRAYGPATLQFYAMGRGPGGDGRPHFARARRSHKVEVDEEGRFSADLPPGQYHAWARKKKRKKGERRHLSGRVTIPPEGGFEVRLKLGG